MLEHPFAEHLGVRFLEQRPGFSRCTIDVTEEHLNPNRVVHGAVVFALADCGMGSAVVPGLGAGESCATVEIKINYFRPASTGALVCVTEAVNRGRTLVNLDSAVYLGDKLIAKANGTYAIFARRDGAG